MHVRKTALWLCRATSCQSIDLFSTGRQRTFTVFSSLPTPPPLPHPPVTNSNHSKCFWLAQLCLPICPTILLPFPSSSADRWSSINTPEGCADTRKAEETTSTLALPPPKHQQLQQQHEEEELRFQFRKSNE